jgi:hypothetical protein
MADQPSEPPPLTGNRFTCFASADPATAWALLTCTGRPSPFLHGLTVTSSWWEGAPIHLGDRGPDGASCGLHGTVLHARPGSRLSYWFSSGPDDPPTYLTWQLRPSVGGTVIELQVDHIGWVECRSEAEDTWLPVLDALQRQLRSAGDAVRPPGS